MSRISPSLSACLNPVKSNSGIYLIALLLGVSFLTGIGGYYLHTFPVDENNNGNGTNTCTNQTLNINDTQNIYECYSNITLFLPVWYEIDVSDESEAWIFVDQTPSYGMVAIYSIAVRIQLINYWFADKLYSFSSESEADVWLEQCKINQTQIGFEERDLYLRSPQYFDAGDVYLNDRINETFQLPSNKAGFITSINVTYQSNGFSGTNTLNIIPQPSNRTSILNFWQCENKAITFSRFKFNSAGQFLDEMTTNITSSYLSSENVVWGSP